MTAAGTGLGPEFSAAMLELARRCAAATDDEAALAIMREATGLSVTDPVADNAELARRTAGALARCAFCPEEHVTTIVRCGHALTVCYAHVPDAELVLRTQYR